MTNEQVLQIYNLGKDERVRHTSIISYSRTTPQVSFSFAKGVSAEEATKIVNEVFPDMTFSSTGRGGQHRNYQLDIFFHIEQEGQND